MSSFLGPVGGAVAHDPAARRLALQKTAFEVAWRINQGMPVTATALVTTVLLAMQGAGLTFGQIRLGLADGMDYLESRSVPRTASARRCPVPPVPLVSLMSPGLGRCGPRWTTKTPRPGTIR